MPGVDQPEHVAEEEREQKRSDVRAVDVSVGQDRDLAVPGLRQVELVSDSRPDGTDQRLDLEVLQRPVQTGLLDVQDLSPDGEDGLERTVPGLLGRASRGVTLHDEDLAHLRVGQLAVGQLAG